MRLFLAVFLASLAACASIKPPPGGEKDTQGPKLLGANPPNATLLFKGKKISFYFDEFLNPGSYTQEVFVSPLLKNEPQIFAAGKTLKVILKDTLESNTTYVFTLGEGIKDYTEKNSINGSIQYAISTGAVLDSGRVVGRIKDAFTQQGRKAFSVMLFAPDSIKGYDYHQKRPIYAAQTDADGKFALNYLKNGRYRIFAVEDKDRSYSYNQATEAIAFVPMDTVFVDSSAVTGNLGIELTAFVPDTLPPKVAKVEFLNPRNLVVNFTETINGARWGQDTLTEAKEGDLKTLCLHLPEAYTDTFSIELKMIADTVGNLNDTLLRIAPKSGPDTTHLKFTESIDPLNAFTKRWWLNDPLPFENLSAYIYLEDTGKKRFEPMLKVEGHYLWLSPPAKIDTTISYTVVVDSSLRSKSGYKPDSTLRLNFRPLSPDGFGSLSGSIKVTQPDIKIEKLKLWLIAPDNKNKYVVGSNFNLNQLKPGSYRYAVLEDNDNNSRWTPGRLVPFRLPEKIVFYTMPVVIRANWEVENFIVEYPPQQKKKP